MKRKASTQTGAAKKKPALERQGAVYGYAALTRKKSSLTLTPELKYNDVTFSTDATTTETVVSLTNFAAGDTALLRDGNKIQPKSLNLRVSFANEALTQSNLIRCVVVLDKQPNAVAPTYATVFDAATVVAQRQVATASRFTILCDDVVTLNALSGTGGAVSKAFWQRYISLPSMITTYSGSAAAEPYTNGLYFMYLGDTAAGATDVDVVGSARLRFLG